MSSERASVPVKTTDAVTFDTTDALPLNTFVRPYKGLLVLLYYNGRTDRASLQPLHVSLFDNGRTTVRPYSRYSSRCSTTDIVTFDTMDAVTFDTTDARPCVPTTVTLRASLQPLLVRAFLLFATRSVC